MHALVTLLLALMGLGFLVFIHELGHYWMARREKMVVEVFSIGFGKPIYSWNRKGVKWQIGMLPFGGYVRIAGMERKGNLEPYQIEGGFYSKKPLARIKVALMGPVANLLFAIFAFGVIWFAGGVQKPFQQVTHLIGAVDPKSELAGSGVHAGAEIVEYNGRLYRGYEDFLYASITAGDEVHLKGCEIDYWRGEKQSFDITLPTWKNDHGLKTIGIEAPAAYLIYPQAASLSPGTPMEHSGIRGGDRIIWADGELIFSREQLTQLMNQSTALLTVRRADRLLLVRVSRLQIADLKLGPAERAEFDDWQYEAGLNTKVPQLFFIAYNLTNQAVIQGPLPYLGTEDIEAGSPALQPGDQIIAVDGIRIASACDLLTALQERRMRIVVQGATQPRPIASWKNADAEFQAGFDIGELQRILGTMGTDSPMSSSGNFRLLSPVIPMPTEELPEAMVGQAALHWNEIEKKIEKIEDPQQRAEAQRELEEERKKLKLGIPLSDLSVAYNPDPFTLFWNGVRDTGRVLGALFEGSLSPKWISGPVGIVYAMQVSWSQSMADALFWMGVISLNLALVNLLPIPILDGGHVCFSLLESMTKKPVSSKVMERLVIPFIVLLVGLAIYITYHDLSRVLRNMLDG